ncbi:MAG: DNA cytosine methyltransferase [Comamonadaceae bacterium]|nr:MAG: DNA cytosine methyltransferase [Comamonadaceae bacterium]
MRFGSICSGIEAASVAWEPLGWKAAWYSEIAPFPRAVLETRFPAVPLLGDFTQMDVPALPPIDILIGGTPCQAFSSTGLRRSLADTRGQLTLGFVKLAQDLAATGPLRYVVWENVPGVLRSEDNAFGCFIAGLVGADSPLVGPRERGFWPNAGLVSGPDGLLAWRVLDAQFFGVPQRRERVFVVFCPRAAGRDPAEVLFDRQGIGGPARPRKAERIDRAFDADGIHPLAFNAYQGYVAPVAGAVLAGDGSKVDVGVMQEGSFRRFMPVERERLQGFPDNWTDLAWPVSEIERDNLRTEAIGNSMPVPVIRWLGKRIEAHERGRAIGAAA